MKATPHEMLENLLDHKRRDARSHTVLVVGAGLHKQFGQQSGTQAEPAKMLADWNCLIERAANGRGLRVPHHKDPAASWESLVAQLASDTGKQANKAEDELLTDVKMLLGSNKYGPEIGPNVGGAIFKRFRDVISLNIDDGIPQLLALADGRSLTSEVPVATGRHRSLVRLHAPYEQRSSSLATTVWFPHGRAARRKNFVLGTRNYGMMLRELERDFGEYKSWCSHNPRLQPNRKGQYAPRTWGKVTDATLKARNIASWLRLFMVADLVFVGTGLDRAETDLWWALHQRQRNLARVRTEDRPKSLIILVTGKDTHCEHLCTQPAGIVPVCYPTWNDTWSVVLGYRVGG